MGIGGWIFFLSLYKMIGKGRLTNKWSKWDKLRFYELVSRDQSCNYNKLKIEKIITTFLNFLIVWSKFSAQDSG